MCGERRADLESIARLLLYISQFLGENEIREFQPILANEISLEMSRVGKMFMQIVLNVLIRFSNQIFWRINLITVCIVHLLCLRVFGSLIDSLLMFRRVAVLTLFVSTKNIGERNVVFSDLFRFYRLKCSLSLTLVRICSKIKCFWVNIFVFWSRHFHCDLLHFKYLYNLTISAHRFKLKQRQ